MESTTQTQSVNIIVGLVRDVCGIEGSDKLFKEKVFFGDDIGEKDVVSGLNGVISIDDFKNNKFMFLINMKAAKLMGNRSEAMILCASNLDKAIIEPVRIDDGIKEGSLVMFENVEVPEKFKVLKGSKISAEVKHLSIKEENDLVIFGENKAYCLVDDEKVFIKTQIVKSGNIS